MRDGYVRREYHGGSLNFQAWAESYLETVDFMVIQCCSNSWYFLVRIAEADIYRIEGICIAEGKVIADNRVHALPTSLRIMAKIK